MRNHHRAAKSESVIVVAQGRLADGKEPLGVEGIIRKVAVATSVQRVGAVLGRVLDEAAAGMAVLRRVAGRDDLHFLDRVYRRGAFLALLVPAGIAERGAVE